MKTHISTLAALALLFFITAALCQGCKKDDSLPWPLSELPPATQTGKNTFGCLINGEPFVPGIYVWAPISHKLEAIYDEPNYGWNGNNNLSVSANYTKDEFNWTIISFGFSPLLNPGNYSFQTSSFFNVESGIKTLGVYKSYKFDSSKDHFITITYLDTINNIVSGKFEMDMLEIDDSTDIIQIRQGRFDVRYFPE